MGSLLMASELRDIFGEPTEDYAKWSCQLGEGRIPDLVLKDRSAVAWTISGHPGVSIDLEGDDPCRPA